MNIKKELRRIIHNNVFLYKLRLHVAEKKVQLLSFLLGEVGYAKYYYKKRTGKNLNLKNPKTINDKLWYLKLYNKDPLLTMCSDKYLVREYVKKCGLGHLLNKLHGVYKNAHDIDFEKLPSPVFLKCNHNSGSNCIFDTSMLHNKTTIINKFNLMLKQNYYYGSKEWNYKNISPRIIAEQVLYDADGNLPLDYKFWCFNGVPKLMLFLINACSPDGTHDSTGSTRRLIFDEAMNELDLEFMEIPKGDFQKKLPLTKEKFTEMKNYASQLSAPFPFARIDFLVSNDTIYFGEITFYPLGACHIMNPLEWENILGSWLNISQIQKT